MTRPLTRRNALALGAVGVGSIAVGAAGLHAQGWPPFGRVRRDDAAGAAWTEPPVIESQGGVLELELSVAEKAVAVAGTTARMLTYNGTVPGPTLHLRPGDQLRVRLVNRLDRPTNLHTHGLEVSPEGAGDNPLLDIAPGESFDYTIDLPADHPPGVFWYHPHRHGLVAEQVFGGLYGAIVVDREDWSTGAPRVVVVSDTTLSGGRVAQPGAMARMDGRVGDTLLTNGREAPALAARAGDVERLLVINACATRYLDLDLAGRPLRVRGFDGGGFAPALESSRVLLVPGGRADLELDIPSEAVDLVARAHDLHSSGMGAMMGGPEPTDATVLTLAPSGAPRRAVAPTVGAAGEVAGDSPAVRRRDLRDATVARRRTLRMTAGMGAMGAMGMSFEFDGRPFDAGRVDQEVALGTVEEWELDNASPMAHPFHLHTWPMQIVSAGEGPVDVRDVVDVPAGESVTVRIAFDRHAGTTVYHCHILDHEDQGMMGVVEAR